MQRFLTFFFILPIFFACKYQPFEEEGELKNWLNQTSVVFKEASIKIEESGSNVQGTLNENAFLENLKIRPFDTISGWKIISINDLIRFTKRIENKYYFEYSSNSLNEYFFKSQLIQYGFTYGKNLIEAIYSRINLYSSERFDHALILTTVLQGKKIENEFYWDNGGLRIKSKNDPRRFSDEKWSQLSYGYQMLPSSVKNLSNTVRDCIKVPPVLLKLSFSEYENKASEFIQNYFDSLYASNSKLVSKTPPTISLKKIKGYITDGYWEKIHVKIDNIQAVGDCLLVQCTIEGDYIELKTSDYEEGAFQNARPIERTYSDSIQAKALKIINRFIIFLMNSK